MDDDFLPDEFVLDDVPDPGHGPTVVFAGPSDPPPVLRAASPPSAPRSAGRRGAYVLVALGLVGGAAIGAIVGTKRAPDSHAPEPSSLAVTGEPGNAVAAGDVGVASGSSETASAPAAAPPSASAPPDPAQQAGDALRDAQSALEKGRTAQAIEAGERAVALDPTDAEVWLVLGAGYDQRRAYAEARRCFATCARVATRGPRGECAALLR